MNSRVSQYPLLSVEDLEVKFGDTTAVAGVDFSVSEAEIVGLVGESGSGKTTVGRAVVGLERPSHGRLLWEGEGLPARRSRQQLQQIQMVFQDPFLSLNPALTVGRVLAELQRAAVRRGSAKSMSVSEQLERVSLAPELGRCRPGELSGGERQRVAIARALAVEPRLVVADEPTSALDVSVQASILELFANLRDTLGTTLLVISHDIDVVRYLCDRVLVMKDGEIVECGPTAEVFADPRSDFTRRLLEAVPRLPPE